MRWSDTVREDERGTILVEFIGSFLLFFLLILSILSLVNIVTAQARVHYALSETANSLSMYGYVLSAADNASQDKTKSFDQIDDVLKKLNNFQSGFAKWENSAPSKVMKSITGVAQVKVSRETLIKDIEQLILNNLSTVSQSGEEYLRSVRITNLKLTELTTIKNARGGKVSYFPLSEEDIKLTVEYEIDYSFMGLPLPFEPKLRVAMSAMTGTWYQQKGYWEYTIVSLPPVSAE